MTKAYLVAMPTIKDNDMFAKKYASKVADTLKPFEGKFLVRTPNKLVKEGDEKSLTVVIEFPSKDKALGWYNSSEHQKKKLNITVWAQGLGKDKLASLLPTDIESFKKIG